MPADLHLHTRYSDGTYTPAELAGRARELGLTAIALTDHDTMEGCAETAAACAAAGVDFIPGAELTAEAGGKELHILGYFLDPAHAELAAELGAAQAVRQQRIHEMVRRLNERGLALAADAVFDLAQCRSPGRPHVARALVAGGFVRNLDQAFEKYLKKDRPAWVPKKKLSVTRAIALIHAAGGVAVMAHPALNHDDALVGRVAALGLDGLECQHPKHNADAVEKYRRLAGELGLVATGGSDCHGRSKNRPTMGTVLLDDAQVTALRAARERRRAGAPASGPAELQPQMDADARR
jgi:hypothetical protein